MLPLCSSIPRVTLRVPRRRNLRKRRNLERFIPGSQEGQSADVESVVMHLHVDNLPPSEAMGTKWAEGFGGPGRDRTDDLFHAMEARSQLRHRPTLRKE